MGKPAREKNKSLKKDFLEEKNDILESKHQYFNQKDEVVVGIETEYFLLNKDLTPLESSDKRNKLIENLDVGKKELGADSVEIATEPISLNSLSQIEFEIEKGEDKLLEIADLKDLKIIRSGTQPFRSLENLRISKKDFFKNLISYYNKDGQETYLGQLNKINVSDAKSASLIAAIHTNMQAENFEDAIKKANYLYMISPYISALSGNARILNKQDTGISDIRMLLWSKSHSNKDLRIGKLDSYYEDIDDYFDRVAEWPFLPDIKPNLVKNAISRYWKDSRIKFVENNIVVESRIASTQPTIEEDVAVHAFCIGRVLYAIDNDEGLLDIIKVNKNRELAMMEGLNSNLYGSDGKKASADEVLDTELDKAKKGLENNNIEYNDYFIILEERIMNKEVPSDRLAKLYRDKKTKESDEYALMSSLNKLK